MGTVQTRLLGPPSCPGGHVGGEEQVTLVQDVGPWGAGGDKAAGDCHNAVEILKVSGWRCRVPRRVCGFARRSSGAAT